MTPENNTESTNYGEQAKAIFEQFLDELDKESLDKKLLGSLMIEYGSHKFRAGYQQAKPSQK